jgi:hypothetical protein
MKRAKAIQISVAVDAEPVRGVSAHTAGTVINLPALAFYANHVQAGVMGLLSAPHVEPGNSYMTVTRRTIDGEMIGINYLVELVSVKPTPMIKAFK